MDALPLYTSSNAWGKKAWTDKLSKVGVDLMLSMFELNDNRPELGSTQPSTEFEHKMHIAVIESRRVLVCFAVGGHVFGCCVRSRKEGRIVVEQFATCFEHFRTANPGPGNLTIWLCRYFQHCHCICWTACYIRALIHFPGAQGGTQFARRPSASELLMRGALADLSRPCGSQVEVTSAKCLQLQPDMTFQGRAAPLTLKEPRHGIQIKLQS